MTDIAAISALPIGAFFREGWLPLTERDDKPILVVNGVEHDATELLRRFPPVAWQWLQLMHDSMGGWEHKIEAYPPPTWIKPEDIRNVRPLIAAALQEPRHDR